VEGEAYSVKSTMKENYTVDKEIVEGTMEAKDVEVTVTYTPDKDNNNNGVDDREEAHYTLTINYVNNKGDKVFEPVVKSLVEGEAYSIKSTMKENYTVDKEVVEGTMEATDVEVTVTYTANRDKNDDGIADQDQKLKVQFIDWDGTILDTQYVMYDDNAVAPQDPTRSNTQEWKYTFSGWLQDYEHVTSDLEVYADYTQEKQQYTVTFLDYYGSEINKVTVDYGTTTVVAPNVPAEIKVGSDNVVSFKEWDTEDYKNVVKNTTVRAKYIMVKASRASLFELKNDYIRQIKGGADDSSRFTDNNVTIAIKDDETGKLADIMSNWTKNSGELKLAVGKNEIRKYLTAEGLNVVDSNNYDIYVLKYNGTKWHLDYQKNDNDVAVYRYNQQGNASAVSKQLKVISESHIITSIDRYADNKLVETVNVHSQGNGTYISDSFNVADINQTGSYTTGLWPFKEYHECYYIVHYDNGGTQKVYWTK
ncbi:MAG: MucBP domain-containing protein, partial [Bacilli bacterium]|nr:MucBP domain-containing protein [Bacilli bacterium]